MGEAKPATSGVRFPPPLIYVIALLISWLLNHLVQIRVGGPPLTWVCGGALILAGVVLALFARFEFARAGTSVMPILPTTALVTTGPFRLSRNPMYVSLTLMYLGIGIVLNMIVWALVLLVLVLLMMHIYVIAREERYLERIFGQEYLEYKSRVRRWL
jgi:protein-S-isoprenylcysteine O-methyltransferase Ste14